MLFPSWLSIDIGCVILCYPHNAHHPFICYGSCKLLRWYGYNEVEGKNWSPEVSVLLPNLITFISLPFYKELLALFREEELWESSVGCIL